MNSKNMNADVLDLSSRIEAMETAFLAYVGATESRKVHCEVAITYYSSHVHILHEKLSALPDVSVQAHLEVLLHSKFAESERLIEVYRREQALSEIEEG